MLSTESAVNIADVLFFTLLINKIPGSCNLRFLFFILKNENKEQFLKF